MGFRSGSEERGMKTKLPVPTRKTKGVVHPKKATIATAAIAERWATQAVGNDQPRAGGGVMIELKERSETPPQSVHTPSEMKYWDKQRGQ